MISFLFLSVVVTAKPEQQSLQIAVINSEKAFELSTEGQKAISQLKEKQNSIQTELQNKDNKIFELEKKLNTQRLTLTFEAQQQLVSDIERLKTERKRYEEDSIKNFRDFQFKIYNRIRAEVVPIVEDIAKEKGISLVFDLSASGIWYFDQAIDITKDVVQKYDALKKQTLSKDQFEITPHSPSLF